MGYVLPSGALHADGSRGDDNVAAQHLRVHAAAGAHTDKGVRAAVNKLLQRNGRRGAADARGADTHRDPVQGARIDLILPVFRHKMIVVKFLRDFLAPARVPGQEHIPAHISGLDLQVKFLMGRIYQRHAPYLLLDGFLGMLFPLPLPLAGRRE